MKYYTECKTPASVVVWPCKAAVLWPFPKATLNLALNGTLYYTQLEGGGTMICTLLGGGGGEG